MDECLFISNKRDVAKENGITRAASHFLMQQGTPVDERLLGYWPVLCCPTMGPNGEPKLKRDPVLIFLLDVPEIRNLPGQSGVLNPNETYMEWLKDHTSWDWLIEKNGLKNIIPPHIADKKEYLMNHVKAGAIIIMQASQVGSKKSEGGKCKQLPQQGAASAAWGVLAVRGEASGEQLPSGVSKDDPRAPRVHDCVIDVLEKMTKKGTGFGRGPADQLLEDLFDRSSVETTVVPLCGKVHFAKKIWFKKAMAKGGVAKKLHKCNQGSKFEGCRFEPYGPQRRNLADVLKEALARIDNPAPVPPPLPAGPPTATAPPTIILPPPRSIPLPRSIPPPCSIPPPRSILLPPPTAPPVPAPQLTSAAGPSFGVIRSRSVSGIKRDHAPTAKALEAPDAEVQEQARTVKRVRRVDVESPRQVDKEVEDESDKLKAEIDELKSRLTEETQRRVKAEAERVKAEAERDELKSRMDRAGLILLGEELLESQSQLTL